jgi:hypothetical protein
MREDTIRVKIDFEKKEKEWKLSMKTKQLNSVPEKTN